MSKCNILLTNFASIDSFKWFMETKCSPEMVFDKDDRASGVLLPCGMNELNAINKLCMQ